MGDATRGTAVSRTIHAPPEAIYHVLLDPTAVAKWLPPDSMRGVVHAFDARQGGSFRISLVYADGGDAMRGKSSESTDTIRGRFVELVPNERVVWATEFESADPSLAGEMIVIWSLAPSASGTDVTVVCENIPPGIKLEDNEAGCRSTLDKLAAFLGA
jgi:uncharacterized protein YndB with AHSA1/START domain